MNCSRCGQPTPEDEMIQFDGRWVCAACKPVFVQELREGCQVPVADPLPAGFEERMLGFWPLVSLSWRVVRTDALPIGALVLLVAVPVNLALTAVDPGEYPSLRELGRYFRITMFLETMVGVLASLGVAKIVEERLSGRSIGVGGGLLHALRRWLPSIGTGLLEGLITFLLTLALVVPGLIWTGYYTFSRTVVSLRGCAGKTALDYSKSLVRGRWWEVVGRIVGLAIIALLPWVAIEVGAAFAPAHPVVTFATGLAFDLCFGFVSVGTTVLFLNLDAVQRSKIDSVAAPPVL